MKCTVQTQQHVENQNDKQTNTEFPVIDAVICCSIFELFYAWAYPLGRSPRPTTSHQEPPQATTTYHEPTRPKNLSILKI